ncbi:hypothetical protein B5E53_10505 [Eubacterium sp. An11]|uniref:recombinase family protein n=1 Tax=Eubacterium sp. An11 TaxID=1965542 RepID=UPI000B37BB25|nr:recombinase family protein [Eubacterium sp. An11]OUQ66458.1 hypothetical protein B5E53_10505 [Eubacterium sp. An11]
MARKSRVAIRVEQQKKPNRIILAGQYGRLSVEDGDNIEQNSIGNQQKMCIHYLDAHPEIKLVDQYFDNGYTGMNYVRPGFQRMMEDIRKGRINCIIVKDISRIGRHFVMTSELVERIFPEMGIRLICINDNYDSEEVNADSSALMMPLKMVMNDYYVKDISRKIRSSISAKMKNGEYLPSSSSIPYGYIRNQDALTYDIDIETAEVVKRIYACRAAGQSISQIARQLNEDNIPSPGHLRYLRGMTTAQKYENAVWIRITVRKILHNPVYVGWRIHGSVKSTKVGQKKECRPENEWQIIKDSHPPIISKELFDQVQQVNKEELQKRKNFTKRNKVFENHKELFQGKVFCDECGSIMGAAKGCARAGAKTSSRLFFDCNRYRDSGRTKCDSHYIRQEKLLQIVTNLLNQQVKMAVDAEQFIEKVQKMTKVQLYQKEASSKYARISIKRKNLEMRLQRMMEDLIQGIIDKEEFQYMKTKYDREYENLIEEETKASADMQSLSSAIGSTQKWIEAVKKYQDLPELNREVMDLLIKEIRVTKTRQVKIILNYADPYQPIHQYLQKIEVMEYAI